MARTARSPRSRASIGNTTPNKEADTAFKTPRTAHNTLRRQQYKRAKRSQQVTAVKADFKTAAADDKKDPTAKKDALVRRGELYRTWKPRSEKRVAALERLVKAQQAEIQELRRLARGSGAVPSLEPVVTPRKGGAEEDEEDEADSSPVKIQQQLMEDAEGVEAVEESTVIEDVEMGGIENEVDYPALPSVEAEEATDEPVANGTPQIEEEPAAAADKEDTPAKKSKRKSKKEEAVARESSADTTADTPRNIRRSPRKRAVKRKSAAGL